MITRIRFSLLIALGALASACGSQSSVASTSDAASAFKGTTTTVSGETTWDSDLVNIEQVTQTGRGVYVAVLDTGLMPNWRDYFPEARVATQLGTGFDQPVTFGSVDGDPCGLGATVGKLTQSTWVGSTGSTHGTHVTSTILGYYYRSNSDAAAGFVLPPIMVRGIAPDVTIIPVRVLADYQVPARPQCTDPGPLPATSSVFGTDAMIAAGIRYVTGLANAGYRPMVINMSLGGPGLDPDEQAAIDEAIAAGVIVVASAGNEGTDGMGFPGAYAPVISAGSAGWTKEWFKTNGQPRTRMWWLQSEFVPYNDIPEPTPAQDVYVSDFSSRELAGQQLDVLAPGSWVRGPFAGDPGYNHLPWWSRGIADLRGGNSGNFYYVGGTSMAAPHVTSIAALLLQKNHGLQQAQVESILKSTALPIPPSPAGGVPIFDFDHWTVVEWGADATGAGLVQADAAMSAVP